MLFIKAIICGAGLYIGWGFSRTVDQILYRKYGKTVSKKIQKIMNVENKKKVKRTIGFESKWEES